MPAKALRLCVCVLVVVCACTQMNRLAGQVGAVQAQTNKPRYQFDFGRFISPSRYPKVITT